MNMEVREPRGRAISPAHRQGVILEQLRQLADLTRFADRKTGIRSYQSHVRSDPWLPILFIVCFVLPTLLGAVYYGLIASDQYVTEAQFAIRPAVGSADKATPDAIGTNAGTPNPMIAQDTLITYEYIRSQPMLEAITAKLPIREWYGRDSIDYFSRFDPEKPIEKFQRYWRRRVDADVESQSGVMSLTVSAFDPAEALAIAQAVMKEAERMVNSLSANARNDALAESARELTIAQERVTKVEREMRDLRNQDGVLDAKKENEATIKLVGELRAARINLAVQLAIGQRDLGPEARRIVDIKQQIRDLDANIARIEKTSASQDPEQKRLLSDALTRSEALEHKRKVAEKYLEQVRAAHERARILAARQVEYFSSIVEPVKAESSTEPRRLLMISLITAGSAVLFAATIFARKLMA
ncbi:capsule biosynthesis protein [Methylobacterium sp. NEAU 140]|uniref:capsule biosynthesis protein n=1 Tax=Methylobacterium sp. NEAU 140 TaxID=3064945 RepID=UPI0027338CA5|nr:capsule biosynthesis protein [Methylobacterium sp. NEAU 140]MDP4023885.1 capsule biosynthesis protein [Methylobacterium sp. NEAU 140]